MGEGLFLLHTYLANFGVVLERQNVVPDDVLKTSHFMPG
jgi:hypothetical protein